MGRLGFCLPCGEARRDVDAVLVIDGDPMCAGCAREVEAGFIQKLPEPVPLDEAMADDLCRRGCGNTRHRGRCKGEVRKSRAPAMDEGIVTSLTTGQTQVQKWPKFNLQALERGSRMDTLVAEEVSLADVPLVKEVKHPQGRAGELWVRFLALATGKVLKVQCRDTQHVGQTDRGLRSKARKANVEIKSQRVDSTYYCWRG